MALERVCDKCRTILTWKQDSIHIAVKKGGEIGEKTVDLCWQCAKELGLMTPTGQLKSLGESQ